MKQVFHSSELFNEHSPVWQVLELLTSFLAIILSAYIAIWIFKRGVKREKLKELERLLELEEYIKISIANLYDPIEKQIQSLKQFAIALSKEENVDHSPESIVSLHTKNIKWISQEEFHKIFVGRRKGDLTKKSDLLRALNADFDYVDAVNDTLKEHFSYFMTKYEKYEADWDSSIKKMSEVKDRMQTEIQMIRMQNPNFVYPFLSNLNQLYNTWTQQADYKEWHVAVKHFLTPLETLCRSTNGDHNALTILSFGTDCIYADTNVRALKAFIKRGVVYTIRRLRRAEKRLKYVMDTFDKMPRAN